MMNPFRRLRELGIVGMNRRNAAYILEHNPRTGVPLGAGSRISILARQCKADSFHCRIVAVAYRHA